MSFLQRLIGYVLLNALLVRLGQAAPFFAASGRAGVAAGQQQGRYAFFQVLPVRLTGKDHNGRGMPRPYDWSLNDSILLGCG
jgi:hypothetical protein